MINIVTILSSISGAIIGAILTGFFQQKLAKRKTQNDKKIEIYSLIVRNMELILLHSNGSRIYEKGASNELEIGYDGEYVPRENLAKETLTLIAQVRLISGNQLNTMFDGIWNELSGELSHSPKPFKLTFAEWLNIEVGNYKRKIIRRIRQTRNRI